MRKLKSDVTKYVITAGMIIIIALGIVGAVFVTKQTRTKNLGGNMTIELDAGQKLEEITWKDDSLWYVTRPMREDEFAETHTFQQSSAWGIFEGTVTIIESEE